MTIAYKKPTTNSQFAINEPMDINANGAWKGGPYKLDEKSAYALQAAMATGRPLLVRGEPGIGKSQLAHYAADKLGRMFVSEVVNINTEGQDLLWRYDPVARLNDAQLGLGHLDNSDNSDNSDNANHEEVNSLGKDNKAKLSIDGYINPGVLWWVYDWGEAQKQYDKCRHKMYMPPCDDVKQFEKGVVLLIDEIDKADPSVPNSLLEVFGNGGFYVPMLSQNVGAKKNDSKKDSQEKSIPPLVIITTNEERELPPAFLRRCLVLDMKLDDKDELYHWWQSQEDKELYPLVTSLDDFDADKALVQWLGQERAEVHFPNVFSAEVKKKVARYLIDDRVAAGHSRAKPGQAEYIDLLRALDEMTEHELTDKEKAVEHLRLLERLRPFTLAKG